METLAKTVQVLSIVAGVVISVLSFLYMEAVKAAAILANREGYSQKELASAKRRFRELYVAELSMVESPEVEAKMVVLALETDPSLKQLNPAQDAAYKLAHALRDSFAAAWGTGPL